MLKRRGKTLKNQAELSWETGPLLSWQREVYTEYIKKLI